MSSRRRPRTLAAAVLVGVLALTACSTTPPTSPAEAGRAGRSRAGSPARAAPLDPLVVAARRAGPVRPTGPRQAARQLATAHAVVLEPRTATATVRAAGLVQQLAVRTLADHPEWDADVRARLVAQVEGPALAAVASRREFLALHGDYRSDTLPAWRIAPPLPYGELLGLYRAAERSFGVGWEYLAAINLVESGLGRIRGTSVAGAQGPMQFIPSTWAAYGRGDVEDPRAAIPGAARYLRAMGFRAGDASAVDAALYRYNNHPAYVRGVRLLAQTLERQPLLFRGYYHWDVFYLTSRGDVRLPVGYDRDHEVPVDRYLASH